MTSREPEDDLSWVEAASIAIAFDPAVWCPPGLTFLEQLRWALLTPWPYCDVDLFMMKLQTAPTQLAEGHVGRLFYEWARAHDVPEHVLIRWQAGSETLAAVIRARLCELALKWAPALTSAALAWAHQQIDGYPYPAIDFDQVVNPLAHRSVARKVAAAPLDLAPDAIGLTFYPALYVDYLTMTFPGITPSFLEALQGTGSIAEPLAPLRERVWSVFWHQFRFWAAARLADIS